MKVENLPSTKVDCFGIRRMHGRITVRSLVIANEFFELFVVSSSCYQILKEIIHLFHLNYYKDILIILTEAELGESIQCRDTHMENEAPAQKYLS